MTETEQSKELKRSMGRLVTDQCLRCGDKLLLNQFGEYNEYHCCGSCTDFIERERYKVLHAVEMGRKSHKEPNRKHLAFREKCVPITYMGEV